MPIYAYRCATCGHAKDVLQKVSDPVLSTCPACGAETYSKQVTAAGFQLKGSGWYVTDFRGDNAKKPGKADADSPPADKADKPDQADKADKGGQGDTASASKPADSSAKPAAAPAAAPAASAPAAGGSAPAAPATTKPTSKG